MQIELVTTTPDFDALEPEWRAIESLTPHNKLRPIGSGGDTAPDDLGILFDPVHEHAVARAFVDPVLIRVPGWQLLDLVDLPADSALVACWTQKSTQISASIERTPTNSDPDALVSVVIPAYNARNTLAQTLDSLFAQTHRNLDVVVVDDGSTDGTAEVLEAYAGRVRMIRQANAGIAAARNVGVQAARGEYIALLDADDLCRPDRIAQQLRYLQAHPDILLCSSDFGAFDETGPLVPASYCGVYYSRCSPQRGGVRARYPRAETFALLPEESARQNGQTTITVYWGEVYDELVQGNFIHPPTVMFRREALQRAGMFDTEIMIVCEWEWFVRVARVGLVAHLDIPLLDYRRSPTQISASPRTALDSLSVAKKIHARDTKPGQRRDRRVLRHLGALSLSAADALAEMEPGQALGLLASSVFIYHHVKGQTLRTLFKIAMPSGVLNWLRSMRTSAR